MLSAIRARTARPALKVLRRIAISLVSVLAVLACPALFATPDDAPRSSAPYFTPAASSPKAPDADGFVQRWLLLEQIVKPNRTNTVLPDSYVINAFNTEYFPNQFTVAPRNEDKLKVGGHELAWQLRP